MTTNKSNHAAGTIKVDDRITFRCLTRWGRVKATRVVTGFYRGEPTVRYNGWGNFVVHDHEIIAHADKMTPNVWRPWSGGCPAPLHLDRAADRLEEVAGGMARLADKGVE